jgi:integrase
MPRKLNHALTPLTVKNAKTGRHTDGGGLNLLVKDSGARSWVFRFMLNGKSRDVGLGAAAGPDAISLSNARDLASALRLKVKAGIDPLEQRQRRAAEAIAAAQAANIARVTFRHVAEAYIAANEGSWRNDKHRQQWRNTLASYVYPVIGDLPVADIATAHVLQIVEPIWQTKPETASRVRGRIEMLLDAAKARGYREGENPARWRGHIAQILPARPKLSRGHHKAMPYAELPSIMGQFRAREAMAALALEFLILTATRTSEVLGATWGEVDLDKAIWTIPAVRMKAGKEHRVPVNRIPVRHAVDYLRQHYAVEKGVDNMGYFHLGGDPNTAFNEEYEGCKAVHQDARARARAEIGGCLSSAKITVWKETSEGELVPCGGQWAWKQLEQETVQADTLYFATTDWNQLLPDLTSEISREYFANTPANNSALNAALNMLQSEAPHLWENERDRVNSEFSKAGRVQSGSHIKTLAEAAENVTSE